MNRLPLAETLASTHGPFGSNGSILAEWMQHLAGAHEGGPHVPLWELQSYGRFA
jgi:cation transport regulator ChaC